MLDESDLDAEEGAQLFRGEQFPFGTVGHDAALPHHDDAVDFGKDVGQMMRDHEDTHALAGDAAKRLAQFALSGKIEGVGGLVEQEHFGLVDEGAGDHDAALFTGGHFPDELGFEMRGLHEVKSLVGAIAHLGRDVQVGPEGGGGEESGDDGIEAGGDGGALAGELRGDDAEMGAKLRDVPAFASEQAELGGGGDDGVALAGDGFDERGFAAAVGAEDGEVFAAGDAKREVVEDNVVAAGDRDIAHEEEVRWVRGENLAHRKIITEGRRQRRGNTRDRMARMSDRGQTLNLWKKHLGRVPPEVWARTELEGLVLADNDLEEIPEEIGRLQRLRMLDLGHNRLRQVPEALGELEGLSDFLYLHDNRLASLPGSMARLKRLRYLNVSENQFTTFPEAICAMSGLAELRVTDNLMEELPETIGQLTSLRELHLRNNRLTSLPETIGKLRELRLIDLRGNPLGSLPDAVAELPRLEKLDLRWVTTLAPPVWMGKLEERGCLVYW